MTDKSKKNKRSRPDKIIVLVGLMGAGKTSIGRRVACALDIPFVDADTEIEEAAGCSVAEIFEKYGEDAFREGEKKVIARLLDGPPKVIATGGGAFMNEETRNAIKDKAVSIWLKAEIPVLLERVARKNTRPLLATGDPESILRDLAKQREPVYAQADLVVESSDGPIETVVEAALAALRSHCAQEARP